MKKVAKFVDLLFLVGLIVIGTYYALKAYNSNQFPIKTIGTTADGKYPIYGISSYKNADGLTIYFTFNDHKMVAVMDIVTYVNPITQEDFDSKAYSCTKVLCRDADQNVVGTNPTLYLKLDQGAKK